MELQITSQKKVWLEAISHLYSTSQVFVQWKDMEQTGSSWNVIEQNSLVGELINDENFAGYLSKSEDDRIAMITAFIQSQQVIAPVIPVENSLDIPISPIDGVLTPRQ